MDAFQLFNLFHREKNCLAIRLNDYSLYSKIKKIPGICWSKTHKCWYGEYTKELEENINRLLKQENINPEKFSDKKTIQSKENSEATNDNVLIHPFVLNPDDKSCLDKFVIHMEIKRFSSNTINNYTTSVITFLKFFHKQDWRNLTQQDMERFQKEIVVDKKLSSAYQNILISAIKKFYEAITGQKPDYSFLSRPKSGIYLPNILSLAEVKTLLICIQNTKHRMMLSLIYACGLRSGDLINLQPTDILSDRGLLHIKGGKGNKDRVVPISMRLIDQLREYYKIYTPEKWLFEGQKKGEQYSYRSLQMVMQKALEKTAIKRHIKLHDLRHSYATHLMEAGTNQRLIQEALGHKSSKTTEIYTHVCKTNLLKMYNPFDDLGI